MSHNLKSVFTKTKNNKLIHINIYIYFFSNKHFFNLKQMYRTDFKYWHIYITKANKRFPIDYFLWQKVIISFGGMILRRYKSCLIKKKIANQTVCLGFNALKSCHFSSLDILLLRFISFSKVEFWKKNSFDENSFWLIIILKWVFGVVDYVYDW